MSLKPYKEVAVGFAAALIEREFAHAAPSALILLFLFACDAGPGVKAPYGLK